MCLSSAVALRASVPRWKSIRRCRRSSSRRTFSIQSNSAWAQGGIAGVLNPLDDVANHAADTIAAGKGLCDEDIVNLVVREAPERIRELEQFGANFDKHNGEIALTQEGGHSFRGSLTHSVTRPAKKSCGQ